MAVIDVINRYKAATYNGSSTADILAACGFMCNNGATQYITCDVNSGMTNSSQVAINFRDGSNNILQTYTFATNMWIVVAATGVQAYEMPTDYFSGLYASWTEMTTTIGASAAFASAVQSATAAAAGAFGSYPNLVVNGLSNANFDVPIRPMMPSNTFTAVPVLTGSASLLGSLSITGLTSGTIPSGNTANKLSTTVNGVTMYDRVRVNVANSGELQLTGAALLVHVTP